LLTEWTQKAGGYFKADSVLLIEKGACAVVEDVALHLEREFEAIVDDAYLLALYCGKLRI